MLFSGYQLGIHLLNSTFREISLDRESTIRNHKRITIIEQQLQGKYSSRNSKYILEATFTNGSKKIFVKQPRFVDPALISSILNENYVLSLFKAANLKPLNTYIGYDPFQNLLFQDFIAGNLLDATSRPPDDVLLKVAENLGKIFTQTHSITLSTINKISNTDFPNKFGFRKPFLFVYAIRDFEEIRLSNPTREQFDIITLLSNTNYHLLKTIQKYEWDSDTLLHFDFKFDHLFLNDDLSIAGLVDWEMADLGDRHWDIALIWLELIKQFMYQRKSFVDILNESLPFLNRFLKHYTTAHIDTKKLKIYLGILLLERHFQRLFDSKNDIKPRLVKEALSIAVSLIEKPGNFALDIQVNSPLLQHDINFLFTKKPIEHHKNTDESTTGTLAQVEELVEKLIDDFPGAQMQLKDYIYRWFNGNLDKQIDANITGEVAINPQVGTEVLLEDYWWRVEGNSKNNSVNIRKNSIRRVAEPGTFIYLNHDPRNDLKTNVWAYVKCLYPNFIVRQNDAREERSDLWVYSQVRLPRDYGNWVRFYFNLKGNIDGINLFIDCLSSKLNERQIPFEIKLRNSLSSYTRTDSAILFIHRQHTAAALDSITITYNRLKEGNFIDTTASPKFTKVVNEFNGLSYGENPPGDGFSFGTLRAGLIANFVGPTISDPDFQKKSRLEKKTSLKRLIVDGFENAEYNIYELYRNPYPPEHEYKYRIDKFAQKLRKPALLDVGIDQSIAYQPRQRYLKAARTIGFSICREAVWYGDYCTWFCFKKNERGDGYFVTATEDDLWGIALFLCHLARLCPQERIFEECLRGIFLSIDLGAGRTKTPDTLLADIETYLIAAHHSVFFNNDTIDYRLLRALLYDGKVTFMQAQALPLVEALSEKYVDKGVPFQNAYFEGTWDSTGTEFNPTLTHGIAALGYLFLLFIGNTHRIKTLSTYYNIAPDTPGFL